MTYIPTQITCITRDDKKTVSTTNYTDTETVRKLAEVARNAYVLNANDWVITVDTILETLARERV